CRPHEDWSAANNLPGIFGWQRIGQEWSAVVDSQHSSADDAQLTGQLSMMQRREISLPRWFAARVNRPASGDIAPSSEVTSHA
ncbi:MAG: hypothetical protein MI861_08440, partial [Pirellulales bacterium]|nr:hypothetical protein [Pirellulales bacterium]